MRYHTAVLLLYVYYTTAAAVPVCFGQQVSQLLFVVQEEWPETHSTKQQWHGSTSTE